MIHDLTFLNAGGDWPPKSEAERLKRYRLNRYLYESLHDKVYTEAWTATLDQTTNDSLEAVVDFPKRLSNLWADLLVGEPPTYTTSGASTANQKTLTDLVERNHLNTVIREATIDASRFGDGLLKVRLEDGKAKIEAVSPELWFPVVRRGDVRRIEAHVLAWTFENTTQGLAKLGQNKDEYLYAEIHTSAAIEYRLHHLENGKIGKAVGEGEARRLLGEDFTAREENRAGEPLIVHIPNQRTSNRLYGYDDYTAIDSHLQRLEVRMAQWSRINTKHGDPAMAGPPIEAPEAGSVDAARLRAGEKYFTVETDADGRAAIPEYIQRDLDVESIKGEIEKIEEHMYVDSETSPTGFGVSRTGYAESGTSLRLRMKSELSKAARLRTIADPCVKDAVRLGSILERREVSDLDIGWKDGLPDDEKERSEIEAQKRQAGLTSLVSAIMRLEDMEREEAEEEVERIREEGQQASPEPDTNGASEASQRVRDLIAGAVNDGTSEANGNEPE